MKKKYWIILGIATVLVLVIILLVRGQENKVNVYSRSDKSIMNLFECSRLTTDARETDVFCAHPDFYRNTNISEKAYSEYLACTERLKSAPPTEEYAKANPGPSESYSICADKTKFQTELQKFRQHLAELKEKTNK
jgi:hypothetical protein